MGVSRLWCRAEYRQRWLQHVTVALLIGFVGAAVLTCVAAAGRTTSAYPRYLRTQSIADVEASLAEGADLATVRARVAAIDGVHAVGAYDALYAAPDRDDMLPGVNFMIFTPLDDDYGRTVDRIVVLDGRMPTAGAADEIIVNERAVREFGLGVGSQFTARSVGMSEKPHMLSGDFARIEFAGPRPALRVVGVGRARVDLTGSTYVNQYGFATPAFAKKYAKKNAETADPMYGFGAQLDVRYTPDADRDATASAIADIMQTEVNQLDEAGSALQDTARIQSIALLLIGLTALLAGVLVISQAIGRMIRSSRPGILGLRELGVDRNAVVRAATLAFLPAALAGIVLALVGAWLGSRWFPTGLLGRVEVARGMQIDGVVFGVGAVVALGAIALRVALGAAQATAPPRPSRPKAASWTDRSAAALSPAAGTGVRWAIGRADGKRPLTGFVAAIIGVAGLLAVTTYTGQLEHVVSTPSTYGDPGDSSIELGDDAEVFGKVIDFVLAQDSVGAVTTYALASRVDVDRDDVDRFTMQAWAFEAVRGDIGPTVVRGRAPTRDTEALLGPHSAQQLDVGLGDTVNVTGSTKDPHELTVVGMGLFPVSDTDQIATGVVTTKRVFDALAPEDPRLGVGFQWKPGTDVEAGVARFSENEYELDTPLVPPDIANMRVVRSYPWWLAGFLVVLAMLATTNALVVSTRRRRHEMAILGAIGFGRRQLGEAVATQGATVGLFAAAVGVPAGLLVGKWVWTIHAERIGLSTSIALPVGIAIAVGAITIALTCLIAIIAGWGALRGRLATALRTE